MTGDENEVLTRVGPGTPMGNLIRQYWLPALLSAELPAPDSPPLRLRLLGEDLVAFRDSNGEVGVLEEYCPHRRASLFLGRNEEGGLRCVYHGAKFATSGECLEFPSDAKFRKKIRATAYPCEERNGIIWTHMGLAMSRPRTSDVLAPRPPLPDLEWNLAPQNRSVLWRSVRACNWLQTLEGDVDSIHQSFLHTRLDDSVDHQQYVTVPGKTAPAQTSGDILRILRSKKAPVIETVDTEGGVMWTAKRAVDDDNEYHRIRHFFFPCHTVVGGNLDTPDLVFNSKAWVPMDDTHTLILESQFRPERPWTDKERAQLLEVRNPWGHLPETTEPGGAWKPRANRENDYLRDLKLQRHTLFCGILSNPTQDTAVQESMGPIVDRTREQLFAGDSNIIQLRHRLLAAARNFADKGSAPPGTEDSAVYRCRPTEAVLPKSADWVEQTRQQRNAVVVDWSRQPPAQD